MNFSESRYCSITRFLASSIGLWPYQNPVQRRIQVFFSVGIIVLAGIFQFTAFFTHEFSYPLLLMILSHVLPKIIFVWKFFTFIMNMNEVKTIFEWIQYDWNTLTNIGEREIIEKYANNGRNVTTIFTIIIFPALFLFVLSPFVPTMLDAIVPLNESRPCKLPHVVEYFLDQDKYFYLILLHIDICDLIGAVAVTATETAAVVMVQHVCGLFEIVSFRFDRVVEDSILHILGADKPFSWRRRIKSVAQIHQRALEFIDFMNDTFASYYVLLLGIGVLSLSLDFVILSQTLILRDFSDEFLIALILIAVHLSYMFCCNYIGQEILDHSHDVFIKTYNTRWYMAPLSIRKSLLFFMRRSIKSSCFVTAGVFTPSYMGFSSLASSSMSYFMVLYSISRGGE